MISIPRSTYRLQFNSTFTFEDASRVADYIQTLGVTHIYASPWLQTTPDSTHGYDVTDFKSVSQALGGERAHELYIERLADLGLRQILDIVPNHMSLTQDNPYWRDVLENGPASRYAEYFDIDWLMHEERFRNKVLLPILPDQYGVVLKAGGIRLTRSGARFEIVLDKIRLPVAPASMSAVLATTAHSLHSETLTFLADSLAALRSQNSNDRDSRIVQQQNLAVLLSMFTRYLVEKPTVMDAIDNTIADVNHNLSALNDFLEQQHYRLAYWKAANQDLGYRRFFDINTLIGVQVEDELVFLDTHERILQWLQSGAIDGVRVDHADGLRDPHVYFQRLRQHAPHAWILAEKILARDEVLPKQWPISGTTGYNFLNIVSGLFISPQGLSKLTEIYDGVMDSPTDYLTLVHDNKIAVMAESLGSDVNRISALFLQICESDLDHRDHSRADIRHAVREIAACFSVYRTYISPEDGQVSDVDEAVIQSAISDASFHRPEIDRGLFDFIGDVLLLRKRGPLESQFLLQFQQFTSPVMAKGFEDTVLYCYNRLIGANEVGSSPNDPTVSVEDFHRRNEEAQLSHPERMVTLTTHDTKRSEDVRARLFVLSEVPDLFKSAVDRWFTMNAVYRVNEMPDPNTEFLYYQTLIGAWPISVERALLYMNKATREAKQQTSWTQKNFLFENHLEQFIRHTLSDKDFVAEIVSFVQSIQTPGRTNSLAQTLLKCTVPGIPDLYQGSELWDHRLVDPDNRGPIDFDYRRMLFEQMVELDATRVMDQIESGMPKLWTIHHALKARQQYAQCFGISGDYAPLIAEGPASGQIVAFLRGGRVATIVPRLSFNMPGGWDNTIIVLPRSRWKNVMTSRTYRGNQISVAELFREFPVALLTSEDY